MKKLVGILFTLAFVVLLIACEEAAATDDEYVLEQTDAYQETIVVVESTNVVPLEQVHQWTIEELGEIIDNSEMFWQEWRHAEGRFSWEHRGNFDIDMPDHLADRYFSRQLFPTSGFASIDDVRNYLLQYYTDRWIDLELLGENTMLAEYDGVLYMRDYRGEDGPCPYGCPNWESARHILLEQEGNQSIVETTVPKGAWLSTTYPFDVMSEDVLYHFVFIDGRIDRVQKLEANEQTFSNAPEEFGEVIVARGMFNEDLRLFRGMFSKEHISEEEFNHEILGWSFRRLLPTSGFENTDDTRNHLLQYYTVEKINFGFLGESPDFVDYDGNLYIDTFNTVSSSLGTRRFGPNASGPAAGPDWETATHFLIEQDGDTAIVETTVLVRGVRDSCDPMDRAYQYIREFFSDTCYATPYEFEARFRFTFIDGKIDGVWQPIY